MRRLFVNISVHILIRSLLNPKASYKVNFRLSLRTWVPFPLISQEIHRSRKYISYNRGKRLSALEMDYVDFIPGSTTY